MIREVFNVSQHGEEVAFALAIIRRTQMENFWRSSALSHTPSSRATAVPEQRVSAKQMLQKVRSRDIVHDDVCEALEPGLFFDSCAQAWVVRWLQNGELKRKHFRAAAADSFIRAFEFNDALRRKSSP